MAENNTARQDLDDLTVLQNVENRDMSTILNRISGFETSMVEGNRGELEAIHQGSDQSAMKLDKTKLTSDFVVGPETKWADVYNAFGVDGGVLQSDWMNESVLTSQSVYDTIAQNTMTVLGDYENVVRDTELPESVYNIQTLLGGDAEFPVLSVSDISVIDSGTESTRSQNPNEVSQTAQDPIDYTTYDVAQETPSTPILDQVVSDPDTVDDQVDEDNGGGSVVDPDGDDSSDDSLGDQETDPETPVDDTDDSNPDGDTGIDTPPGDVPEGDTGDDTGEEVDDVPGDSDSDDVVDDNDPVHPDPVDDEDEVDVDEDDDPGDTGGGGGSDPIDDLPDVPPVDDGNGNDTDDDDDIDNDTDLEPPEDHGAGNDTEHANNGHGNGDQEAPGNSGDHNNAENDQDDEDVGKSHGGHHEKHDASGGGKHEHDEDRDGKSGGGHSKGGGSSGGHGKGDHGNSWESDWHQSEPEPEVDMLFDFSGHEIQGHEGANWTDTLDMTEEKGNFWVQSGDEVWKINTNKDGELDLGENAEGHIYSDASLKHEVMEFHDLESIKF
jgi:hypothetical protein